MVEKVGIDNQSIALVKKKWEYRFMLSYYFSLYEACNILVIIET
jgi:hypothetical protein